MTVVCICLSPGLQRSVRVDALTLGEVNRLQSVCVDIGGKGVNVCRVLQRIGVPACCLAQGGDNADELMTLAAREGLDLRLIPSSGRLRTCTTVVEAPDAGGRRVTELVEPASAVAASCVDLLRETVRQMLPAASALVIAGSMASGFPASYQTELAALGAAAGVPVLLDLQGAALRAALVAGPALVKINLAEFVATFLAGRFCGGEQSGELAAPELSGALLEAVADVTRVHATTFVLTRGARSILLARAGELRVLPVRPLAGHEILSPIGSGDSFLAGLLAALLAGSPGRGKSMQNLFSLHAVEPAIAYATACAQSNARTIRPGFLDDSFSLRPQALHN
jgi:fructose-1-phosphate kinase PfkB-like protein